MFGKLFTSMYDGTLAMNGPWEALVTFQQFIILADRIGIVDMTADAISRRTTIPIGIIHTGITELEKTDDGSRSPAEEGRRIVRLSTVRDWGWQIVNYAKYRDIRDAEHRREYMRQFMADKRAAEKPQSKQKPVRTTRPLKAAPAGFDTFWKEYPLHKNRRDAEKAWLTLNPDTALQAQIMAAVSDQKKGEDWLKEDGKYIPHGVRWLTKRRWEDEVRAAPLNGHPKPSETVWWSSDSLMVAKAQELGVSSSGLSRDQLKRKIEIRMAQTCPAAPTNPVASTRE